MPRGIHFPLLGKVYADMKTRTKSLNELTYTLIGDPALRLIIPAARVVVGTIPEMSYVGENLVLKGEIRNEDGDFLELLKAKSWQGCFLLQIPS